MNVNPLNCSSHYLEAGSINESKEDNNTTQDLGTQQPSSLESSQQAQHFTGSQNTNTHIPPPYHPAFAQQAVSAYGGTGAYAQSAAGTHETSELQRSGNISSGNISSDNIGASSHTAVISPPLQSVITDYSSAITTLLSGSTNARSREEIAHRVNMAHNITSMEEDVVGQKKLITSANTNTSNTNQLIYVESSYDLQENTYTVESTKRRNFTSLNISDAILAQLSNVMPKDSDNLPTSLPAKITRDYIVNDITRKAIDEIFEHFKPDSPVITLPFQRDDPTSVANQYLHALLTKTPNGKSTAYMINDFNKAQDTEHTIKDVKVYRKKIPHQERGPQPTEKERLRGHKKTNNKLTDDQLKDYIYTYYQLMFTVAKDDR